MNYSLQACESLLKKSENKYKSAEVNLIEGRIDTAVSDLYYSAFQSVCSLMVLRGVSTSKHTSVRAFVSRELGLKGQLSLELTKMYNKLMDMRHDADYSTEISFSKDDISTMVEQVKEFNTVIRTLINREKGSTP